MKIKECPNCNSPRIAKIQYGLPGFGDELIKDLDEGKVVLGGCCVTDYHPDYKCLNCNALIFKDTGNYIFGEEDEFEIKLLDRYKGCLLGLAVGDAVGTTLEFQPRGSFKPIDDMVGGGPFDLQPGQWTDDTSMALCLATSLIECNGFDAHDQMERYLKWCDEGYFSSTGECFDIGNTVNSALEKYKHDGNPYAGSTDPYSAGNGSIMRLAPIPLYYYPNIDLIEKYAAESSKTTHGAEECIDACRLFARIIYRALNGSVKEDVLLADKYKFHGAEKIESIARGDYLYKSVDDIKGSGYVVDSLEAALWCFNNTDSFKEAILCAANLGDDADTTAAVCGQVAGAYYGIANIPKEWLNKLYKLSDITIIAQALYAANLTS